MENILNICVCKNIAEDFKAFIEREKISDVIITSIPSKCNDKSFNPEKAADIINSHLTKQSNTILMGCKQICSLEAKLVKNKNVKVHQIGYCLEALIDKTLINYFSGQGYYLITTDWLNNYNYILETWGFNKTEACDFFRETSKKILLLDNGAEKINYTKLNELSDYLSIPVEVLPISSDHLRGFLLKIILEWRLKNEKKLNNTSYAKLTKQSADYAMIFDFIVTLVDIDDEEKIINKIFEMINMLCAPGDIYFIPIINGQKEEVLHIGESPMKHNNAEAFLSDFVLDETDSFFIDIVHQGENMGIIIIRAVYFPEHIGHYYNLIKTLSFVFGLAISNARKIALLKNNEEAIRKYSAELSRSNMNKDKFFSIIAHDLKSPFHGFLGLTEMFANDISDLSTEEISAVSRRMHESAINLFKLLENLLMWARMQKGEISVFLEELNLRKLAAKSIDSIKDRANQKGISITNQIPEVINATVDEKMISSIFNNLISNSVKFSRRRGTVVLTAKETDGNMVEVSVADSGIGMTKEVMNKLFQLNEKVGKKGTEGEESTGLGLLLCKEFIEKMGGAIRVESQLDIGSTFYFTLPKSN